MATEYFIVQLEAGVWLAKWDGDPGRTLCIEHAQRFRDRQRARMALEEARTYREFPYAFVDTLRTAVI